METLKKLRLSAMVLLVSFALVSCGDEAPKDKAKAEAKATPAGVLQVVGAGATFPEPLYAKWVAEWNKSSPQVRFSYEGVGSGEGIRRFINREVDFGASDAAMTDEQMAKVPGGVKLVPATAGMIVLAYNLPGVEGDLKLPRDVYVEMFSGKVYRWDDPRIAAVNPGLKLPHKLIQPVVRRDSSGTTFAFTNHLSAVGKAWQEQGLGTGTLIDWPGGAMTARGNEGVAQRVLITVGSVGYMEYGFAKRLGLPVALLQNKDGQYVKPGAASGQAALAGASGQLPANLRLFLPDPSGTGAYPIVSLSWVLVNARYERAETASALKNALNWGLTEGQRVADEMGYLPLPDEISKPALAAVAAVH